MGRVVQVIEVQGIRFAPGELAAFRRMTGDRGDPSATGAETVRTWLREHGWDKASSPRPAEVSWAEAALLRYLAAARGTQARPQITAGTCIVKGSLFPLARRLQSAGLIENTELQDKETGLTVTGHSLTGAGREMAARIRRGRSGGSIPGDLQADIAGIWHGSGATAALVQMEFPLDEWNAVEAAAESAYAPSAYLIRAVIRSWMAARGWDGEWPSTAGKKQQAAPVPGTARNRYQPADQRRDAAAAVLARFGVTVTRNCRLTTAQLEAMAATAREKAPAGAGDPGEAAPLPGAAG